MKKYAPEYFKCQLLAAQTLSPTAFFNAFLSDREKLTMKFYHERLLHGAVTEPLELVAEKLKISLSTLKRDLIKLRSVNFLRKTYRGIKKTSVYVLHEFYARPEVVRSFKTFYITLLKLTKYLYGKAQQQLDGLLIRLKVSYLYNRTLNRMTEARLGRADKPERRSFSQVGETYGANDQGHTTARVSFEEFERMLRPFERISGSDFDEFCFVEEKLHEQLTSGKYNEKTARYMGDIPNGFNGRVTAAEREIGLGIHMDCSCRETPEAYIQRTFKRIDQPAGEKPCDDKFKPQYTLQELRDHMDMYLHQQPAKRDWDTKNDGQPQLQQLAEIIIEPEPIELYDDTVEEEWRPNTQNYW